MRIVCKMIGYLMWYGGGFLMFVFWLMALTKWLGLLGTILAFVLSPGFVIFPIVFWIVEGVFPTFYFMVWGVGIVGLIVVAISSIGE